MTEASGSWVADRQDHLVDVVEVLHGEAVAGEPQILTIQQVLLRQPGVVVVDGLLPGEEAERRIPARTLEPQHGTRTREHPILMPLVTVDEPQRGMCTRRHPIRTVTVQGLPLGTQVQHPTPTVAMEALHLAEQPGAQELTPDGGERLLVVDTNHLRTNLLQLG